MNRTGRGIADRPRMAPPASARRDGFGIAILLSLLMWALLILAALHIAARIFA